MNFRRRIFDLKQSTRGKVIQRQLLNHSQYWTLERLQDYQLAQVKSLLIEAQANVPYYKELFGFLDFDPAADLKSLNDFKQLPLLTKEKARSLGMSLRNVRQIPHIVEKTSGSTGEPFIEHIADRQMAFEKATVWRHWSWAGYRFRDNVAIVRTYVPEDGQPLIKDDALRNFRFYSAYHMDERNTQEYVHNILQWKPAYLRGYPSSLEILANVTEKMGVEFSGLKGLFTASETLTDAQREKIERVFNTRVFDWYGLAEQVVSANECEAHDGMHLNLEYGIWELEKRSYLNDNERMIIGTNLNNHAMPLIRYETGDVAVIHDTEKPCACGRTLPRIKQIRGRKDDILTATDGRPAPSVNFYSLFREFDSIKRFQLIQRTPSAVELRYVAENITSHDLNEITSELKRRLGVGMSVTLHETGDFIKNSVGKRRPVISLIGLDQSERVKEDATV